MVITSLSAFADGATWPLAGEGGRLALYERNALLYEGRHGEVFTDLNKVEERSKLDLPVNLFRLISVKFADLLAGEPPRFTAANQEALDRIVADNDLTGLASDTAIDLQKFGTALIKVRFDKRSIIELIRPSIWYPVVDADNSREILAHVLAWGFKVDKLEYLRAEIHTKGKIENRLYAVEGGKLRLVPLTTLKRYAALKPEAPTGIEDFLVIPIQNAFDSTGVYGLDDFSSIVDLVKELERRQIQVSKILTKHADPSISGPASKVEIDPYSGESCVVGGGTYFGYSEGEPIPQYMTWNAQLPAVFQELELITKQILQISELSPALLGDLKPGLAESGSALKRLLISTLAKVNRIRFKIDPGLKKAIRLGAALEIMGRTSGSATLDDVGITWQDGIPRDEKEIVELEVARKRAALTSTEASLKRLDPEMSEADRKAEAATIEKENTVPAL